LTPPLSRISLIRPAAMEGIMWLRLFIVAILLAFGVGPASAQMYRGKWEAAGAPNMRCPAFDAHITVTGNNIVINIGAKDTYRLRGAVAPDGSFSAEGVNGATSAKGKFTGDTMEMTLVASCGTRTGTGHRAG
jgi:hypothetical protein